MNASKNSPAPEFNLEASIKDFAERGFSKSETARILGLSYKKLMTILEFMPPLPWAPNGKTVQNRQVYESRRGECTPANLRAITHAQEVRRALCAHTAIINGTPESDSLTNLWRRFSPPGLKFRTVKERFYRLKWPLEKALLHPPVIPCGHPQPRDPKTNRWIKDTSHDS